MDDDLPDKVYECTGEVVQLLHGAALLHMKSGNTNCFCGAEVNSLGVKLGEPINFNARLVPQVDKVKLGEPVNFNARLVPRVQIN